jgi:pimeloyl-ACP methyl ester carboxylesterase
VNAACCTISASDAEAEPLAERSQPLTDWHWNTRVWQNYRLHMTHTLSTRSLLVLSLAVAGCQVRTPTPTLSPATVVFEPFLFRSSTGIEVPAELGTLRVPEQRSNPASRMIALRFVRFRATTPNPGPPIVYLAGGPGGSGIGTAMGARFPIFQALRAVADVIALDQRGTGRSNEIATCTPPGAAVSQYIATRDSIVTQFRRELLACFDTWTASGVAIDGYTTRENADDIDALRAALGVEQVSLWGISYGSHLGLATLKYHGTRIHRAVFAGIEGLDQTVKRPAVFDSLIARVQQLIDLDSLARHAYPDLGATMRRVHAQLNASPARVTIPANGGRAESVLVFDAFPLQMIVGGMMADPSGAAQVPLLYQELAVGRYDRVGALLCREFCTATGSYRGMPEAMDIASGISAPRLALIRREAATAILGDAINFPMPHALGLRPSLDAGDNFRAPVRSSVPTLFISGTLDGRTSPAEARDEIRGLRNGNHLIVENGGHNIFEADKLVADAVIAFFRGQDVPAMIRLEPPRFRLR